MNCAKCGGEMAEITVDNIRLDRCGRCQGIWFDRQELEQVLALVEQGRGNALPASSRSPLSDKLDAQLGRCPRCETPLLRTESLAVEGLHYDRCSDCGGAWLDGGELEQITSNGEATAIARFFAGL